MIRPRLPKLASGTRLTTNLVNDIINRTEYAADLLRQYKLIAGNGMYVEPHYDGTRISYLQQVAGGASAKRPVNRYAGYILPVFPNVPSVNDIFLVLNKPFDFPGGELGGLYARDLPLDQRQKVVYPVEVALGGFALQISGGYWADFNFSPNASGLYPSYSYPDFPSTIVPLTGSPFPALGPHPNAGPNNTSFFFGGSINLVQI
jgi:hypothetical protein